ncbi:MAG: thiosulfate oxidation carrier complex protein SoxZ [Pseudomonadota bacterium]
MAKSKIKIRAKLKGDVITVKALMRHPMETGLRKNKKTGELIPAHFIQTVKCEVGGSAVLDAEWSGTISKNPYLSFKFKGAAKGDLLKISWTDNKGESDTNDTKIK